MFPESVHHQIEDLLPFYAAGSLPAGQSASIVDHLAACPRCRQTLREWQVIAAEVRETATAPARLPPLSALVRAGLHPRPTLAKGIASALRLVWAQRAVVLRGETLLVVSAAILLGVLASASLAGAPSKYPAGMVLTGAPPLLALPLLALVPALAALTVAFLYGPQVDPAYEMIAVTPTPPVTLLLARLVLVLGIVGGLAMLGSLGAAIVDRAPLAVLVMAWLGPMLALSALATVLAVVWQPLPAAGTAMALWGLVVVLLAAEIQGSPLLPFSMLSLLHPGSWLVAGEMGLAGLLWLAAWRLLRRQAPLVHLQ